MADRRFETSFKQLPGSDEPGLVLGDDNVVYLIKPDGSRVEVGGAAPVIQSGAGAPQGAVVPSRVGSLYVDTTHGGLHIAVGLTDVDWIAVGGLALFGEAGVTNFLSAGKRDVLALGEGSAIISDVAAQAGSGNGLVWSAGGADGSQHLDVSVGVNGAKSVALASAAGTLGPADGGIMFPTVDPHVAGAWWDNAGTLTKSLG